MESQDIVRAAAGMLLYQYPKTGGIEILTGVSYYTRERIAVFGGELELSDGNAIEAAMRHCRRHAGPFFSIHIPFKYPIGFFGPEIEHKEKVAGTTAHSSISFPLSATIVFAGLITEGEPASTYDTSNFVFIPVHSLEAMGLARGHLAIARSFLSLHETIPVFGNPDIRKAIFSSQD